MQNMLVDFRRCIGDRLISALPVQVIKPEVSIYPLAFGMEPNLDIVGVK